MGLANQKSLGSKWPGIMNNEISERYHKLKASNPAWELLVSWFGIKKTGVIADHTDESRGRSDGVTREGGGGWDRGASAGGGAAAAAPRFAPQQTAFCRDWQTTGHCSRGDSCWYQQGHTDESIGPSDGVTREGGGGWGRGASAGGGAAAAAPRVSPLSSSKWGRRDPELGGSQE